ncbi:NADP-dependent oxidoreductase [Spongiibacter sp. KMU-166]|uniref:NADP-dependent oxidoreductase n=1 Tax=Spongiibacter thalassae TaxID=2721624 RepID=A0ABX1GBM7_9GAMM|nr:NADP-dependent oxidoreductase [Spongiibacter thalassae]NKI15888.1 NADP-dependent oxidoreductase [Spongiibacter thalassae]
MIPNEYRQCVVASRPEKSVTLDNFRLETVSMPELAEGEVLVRTDSVMVNPPAVVALNRGVAQQPPVPVGSVMWGQGVGAVVASKNESYSVGDRVVGPLGWAEYCVIGGEQLPNLRHNPLPAEIPATLALHVLGASGPTAYLGLIELGQPKLGDTVLVSAAAGTVGSLVCQLALAAGCTVVGIMGSDEKGEWLSSMGVHHVINYKREDIRARIAELCPKGVDVYFDNVGGETLEAALSNLAMHARVVLCGATSQYSDSGPFKGPSNYFDLVHNEATMRGFHIFHYMDRVPAVAGRLVPLLMAGKLQYKEDVLEGIEQAPNALLRVMKGENFGTQLVKLAAS